MNRILVVAPDEAGFRQYAEDLHHAAKPLASESGLELAEPIYYPHLSNQADVDELIQRISIFSPDLVHIHHEYGMMGSKVPGRYQFPNLIRSFRRGFPLSRLAATAHTVIQPAFQYPEEDRGWQTPLRKIANRLFLPRLKKLWGKETWGPLDAVTAHSGTQINALQESGCPIVREIPHYVPPPISESEIAQKSNFLDQVPQGAPLLVTFGYLTPEKGTDILIRALPHLPSEVHLVIAGGLRRGGDRFYYESCLKLVSDLQLTSRVQITGFIPFEELSLLCKRADLVVAPFRETSGSGSIPDVLSRGVALVTSDHPINLEINQRVPGAACFFKNENEKNCAEKIAALIRSPEKIENLRKNAKTYAERYSAVHLSRLWLEFYSDVLAQPATGRT